MVVIAMKVLFVTSGAIACNVSSGNTFLNLFGELADTELYSLFTRSEVPDKKIKAAFRIAEAELPRYIFRRDRIGETAQRRRRSGTRLQFEQRGALAARGDLFALAGQDGVEDGAHGRCGFP